MYFGKISQSTVVSIELKCATEIGAENIDRSRHYAGANSKLAVLGTFRGVVLADEGFGLEVQVDRIIARLIATVRQHQTGSVTSISHDHKTIVTSRSADLLSKGLLIHSRRSQTHISKPLPTHALTCN